MNPFPHHYAVSASTSPSGDVMLNGCPGLASALPAEFDGPGDRWSPETLTVAAVADCFALTFKAIAKPSKMSWSALTCEASGTVERVDRVTQFTALSVRASLEIPAGASGCCRGGLRMTIAAVRMRASDRAFRIRRRISLSTRPVVIESWQDIASWPRQFWVGCITNIVSRLKPREAAGSCA